MTKTLPPTYLSAAINALYFLLRCPYSNPLAYAPVWSPTLSAISSRVACVSAGYPAASGSRAEIP
jgi:hypothetical protein